MNYLAIKERESQKWLYLGSLKWNYEPVYSLATGRKTRKRKAYQPGYVYPAPEKVSPFVETHKIIKAENEEDAKCQILKLK